MAVAQNHKGGQTLDACLNLEGTDPSAAPSPLAISHIAICVKKGFRGGQALNASFESLGDIISGDRPLTHLSIPPHFAKCGGWLRRFGCDIMGGNERNRRWH